MGRVFALAGPSGVGKTTFLARLAEFGDDESLDILPRVTLRDRRPGESDDLDYDFYDTVSFLQRLYAGDFVHVEEWGGNIYALDHLRIRDALAGRQDAIVMAGIYGAISLSRHFPEITIVYMHAGTRRTLTDPSVLDDQSAELVELRRRLIEKIESGVLPAPHGLHTDDFADTRLRRSLIELAYVNGLIRGREKVFVLENLRDQMDSTLANFAKIRSIAAPSRP